MASQTTEIKNDLGGGLALLRKVFWKVGG